MNKEHYWTTDLYTAFFMKEIMECPRDSETPNSRMRQLSIILMVFHAQSTKGPPKGAEIAEYVGITRNGIQKTLDQLVGRGLLAEEEVPNGSKYGQGRKAFQYSISNEVLRVLFETKLHTLASNPQPGN